MKKTQKKSWAWRSLYIWYKIMLIYINFKFNFLTKYHSFILKCWRVRMFSSRHFTSHLQHSCPCCIMIQTFAFGSSLYIRYNTAAHVVNRTYSITHCVGSESISQNIFPTSSRLIWTEPQSLSFRQALWRRELEVCRLGKEAILSLTCGLHVKILQSQL
jgi:hypothetical protein